MPRGALVGVLLACALAARGAEAPPWWRELPGKALRELSCAEFEFDTSRRWHVRGGTLAPVEDKLDGPVPKAPDEPGDTRPARVVLDAKGRVELSTGGPDWERYAVTAEVMLGDSGKPAALAAATTLDGPKLQIGYQVELRGEKGDPYRTWASASSRDGDLVIRRSADGKKAKDGSAGASPSRFLMRPDLQAWAASEVKEQTAAALKRFGAEFAGAPIWPQHWFRLRIEITHRQARLWVDGALVASVDEPRWTKGSICLTLNHGDRVRSLRIEPIPLLADGFLPLDLSARFNANGLDDGDLGDGHSFRSSALPPPGRFIEVDGVPFHWSSAQGKPNHLDLSNGAGRDSRSYIFTDAASNDPKRVLLRVPRRQYNQLVLLAAADARKDITRVLNARFVKPVQGMVVDKCQAIPAWKDASADRGATALPVGPMLQGGKPSSEQGRLWLVRVPLDPGAFQDFLASPDERALEIDLAGPPVRPGYPAIDRKTAGIHIFAATLIESPVEMFVTSEEVGHIFVQPQTPKFAFRLRNTTPAPQSGKLRVLVTDFYGKTRAHEKPYGVPAGKELSETLEVPVEKLGLHALDARLEGKAGEPLVRRQTTFAVLPPDPPYGGRQADRDSPFGLWVFVGAHFGASADAAGALMSKAGARCSHVSQEMWDAGFSKKYRIYPAYTSLMGGKETIEQVVERLKKHPQHEYWTIFAETALGERHFHYFPPELLEKPAPMPLTPEEEETFKTYWDEANARCEAARTHRPDAQLIFGNGYPQFIATFLSRGFPRRYLDGLALDFMSDQLDLFFYLREVARHYGYGDLPLHITEGFYVTSGCGYYPDREREQVQSDRYLRGFLRGFAMGMARWGTACEIWDPGGEYYYTGYGSVGLCHKAPELNPKPSYLAYATMTHLLDRARFHSLVPAGSVAVYLLRFDGPAGPVYAAWTASGQRRVSLRVADGATPCLTDSQSNSTPLEVREGRVAFDLTPSPIWLERAGAIRDVQLGEPSYADVVRPSGADSLPPLRGGELPSRRDGPRQDGSAGASPSQILARFETLADWQLDTAPLRELEALNVGTPVKPCAFDLAIVPVPRLASPAVSDLPPGAGDNTERGARSGKPTVAQDQDGSAGASPSHALSVALPSEPGVSPHRLRYAILRPKGREVSIPAGTSRLGLWIRGNGAAWVDLELRDAKGERWHTVRGPRSYEFGQRHADWHVFDGWRYIPWPLPPLPRVSHPREGIAPTPPSIPDYARWRHEGGDGVLDLPARLTGLILEQYGQVLYINQMAPPTSPAWLLGGFLCE